MRPFRLLLLLLPSTKQKGALAFCRHSLAARSPPAAKPAKTLRLTHVEDPRTLLVALTTRGGDEGDMSLVSEHQATDSHTHINAVVKSQRPKSSDALSYYLLWSPTMMTKVMISGLFLGILHIFAGSFLTTMAQKPSTAGLVPSFVSNIVLPLLSSACCSIQLIINALASAGGCAGFNGYLGPLRPYFFAFLVYLTVISRPGLSLKSWLISTSFRFSLALLPELVHLWNNYLTQKWTVIKTPLVVAQGGQPQGQLIEAQIELDIPAMGCVACINKIDASIRATAPQQIVSSESWLDPERKKGGNSSIRLSVRSQEEANAIAESIVQKVQGAGFETCRVESIQIGDPTQERQSVVE